MSNQTAGEALHAYYKTHYFGDKAFTDFWLWAEIGPFKLPTPNIRQRRAIIHLHDLHHLLTGYGTNLSGEGEIAAWELASGFPAGYRIAYLYAPITFLIGCVVAPLKVYKAFRRGWGHKNLCHLPYEKKFLLEMTLDDLKKELALT